MQNLKKIVLIAGFGAALLLPVAAALPDDEELVDNPDYAGWAKFKPGDYIKTKVAVTIGEQTTTTVETTRLVSVDKDKVVVEVASSVTAGGKTQDQPAMTQTFNARISKASLPVFKESGTEKVQAAGKEYSCTVRQVLINAGKDKQEEIGKIWLCDKVPGGVVKVQSEANGRKVDGIVVECKPAG